MKHRIKVTLGDYAVHRVSPAYPELFMPTCSCGGEGAWVETRKVAGQDGGKHCELEDS
jgi:hypothetical protein